MSNMWSQEEIDALLHANGDGASPDPGDMPITQPEQDTLGEIGNICMGTAATTMSTMLDRRVNITTPTVSYFESASSMIMNYGRPFIAVQVTYTEGLQGNNILLLKEEDAIIITNLLLNGSPDGDMSQGLGELQISAMSEVMNQMVGSSATAMSNLLHEAVNISPPITILCNVNEDPSIKGFLDDDEPIVRINFDMEIQDVLKSELMQVIPLRFGRQLVEKLMQEMNEPARPAPAPAAASAPAKAAPPAKPAPQPARATANEAPAYAPPPPAPRPQQHVDVQSMHYQAFDAPESAAPGSENMDIVIDVPLQVTVELGKTRKSIKEILGFGKGSIVVLDRQAGEMVDVQVNGKLIARGEVVVIDDNYGVRITELFAAGKRIG